METTRKLHTYRYILYVGLHAVLVHTASSLQYDIKVKVKVEVYSLVSSASPALLTLPPGHRTLFIQKPSQLPIYSLAAISFGAHA